MTGHTRWLGRHVTSCYAQGDAHGHGRVIAYTDRPTFVIERDDGTRFSWIADMCRLAPQRDPHDNEQTDHGGWEDH